VNKEFYKEIRKRNENAFIQNRSKEIEAKQTGVDIPAFLYAKKEYDIFIYVNFIKKSRYYLLIFINT